MTPSTQLGYLCLDSILIINLGEVGGTMEHHAAHFIRQHMTKPVIAMIVGRTASAAQMGYAAPLSRGMNELRKKVSEEAGAHITHNSNELPRLIKQIGIGHQTAISVLREDRHSLRYKPEGQKNLAPPARVIC